MGWKRWLGGRKSSPDDFPVTIEIVPGALSVRVHDHTIPTSKGDVPCWCYVTDGFAAHGQKELVLILRRKGRGRPTDIPGDPLPLLRNFHEHASQGHPLEVGSFMQFNQPMFGFFGLVIFPCHEVGFPRPADASTMVFLTEQEAVVAKQFGPTRITTRLGERYRHFPFPSWTERGRQEAALPELQGASLLCKLPVAAPPGITAVQQGGALTVRMSASAGEALRKGMKDLPERQPFGLGLELDPRADTCLVWDGTDRGAPTAISPEGSDGSCVSGCIALFIPKDGADDWNILEDGFGVMLSQPSWDRWLAGMRSGETVRLQSDALDIRLEWVPDDFRDAFH